MGGNLQRRFTLIFTFLTVVPLLVLSISIGIVSFDNLRQQSQVRLNTIARVLSNQIEDVITTHAEELKALVSVTGLPQELRANFLQNLLHSTHFFDEVALLDRDGQEVLRFSRSTVVFSGDLSNRSQSPEYTTIRDGAEVYYSDVYFNNNLREPLMTISVPVIDLRTGELDLVLVANFRFRTVWEFLANLNLDSGIVVFVVDTKTNNIVAHPDPSMILRGTQFTIAASPDDMLLATETIELGRDTFLFVVQQPISTSLVPADELRNLTILITVMMLILTIVVVWVVVRQVVRPIKLLSYVAQQIEGGDLSLRAKVQHKDEIGDLARAFNTMTDQFQELLDNSERRVQARTRDLEVVADVSKQVTTVLMLDELLPLIVERTQESFDFYHVSIYVFDPDTSSMALAASAGRVTLSASVPLHPTKRGPVETAARQREALMVNDIFMYPDFLPNPYLPEVRSELAVPMIVGEHLIGVLDLQSDVFDFFTDADLRLMQSLAEQVAVAIQNARLYAQQVQIADELRRVDDMKSQFLASMSHELRTPLNAILNFTQFVKTGKLGSVNDRQVNALSKAIKGSEHLLSLINDVLDVAKIEAGRMELFIEDNINFRTELETVIGTTKVLLEDKPVELVVTLPDNIPLIVGDRRRLRQIMLNLISNACKYTDEGFIYIRVKLERDDLIFEVEDTGVGIAPENYELVFETFKQTSHGLRKSSSTGLGLVISRNLAETHHGSLTFTSQLGVGSTFILRLPLRSHKLLEQIF